MTVSQELKSFEREREGGEKARERERANALGIRSWLQTVEGQVAIVE